MAHVTHTTDGIIPHIKIRMGKHDIEAPVKIVIGKVSTGSRVSPVRDCNGYLVYAAPGGKDIRHSQYYKKLWFWSK